MKEDKSVISVGTIAEDDLIECIVYRRIPKNNELREPFQFRMKSQQVVPARFA